MVDDRLCRQKDRENKAFRSSDWKNEISIFEPCLGRLVVNLIMDR